MLLGIESSIASSPGALAQKLQDCAPGAALGRVRLPLNRHPALCQNPATADCLYLRYTGLAVPGVYPEGIRQRSPLEPSNHKLLKTMDLYGGDGRIRTGE